MRLSLDVASSEIDPAELLERTGRLVRELRTLGFTVTASGDVDIRAWVEVTEEDLAELEPIR